MDIRNISTSSKVMLGVAALVTATITGLALAAIFKPPFLSQVLKTRKIAMITSGVAGGVMFMLTALFIRSLCKKSQREKEIEKLVIEYFDKDIHEIMNEITTELIEDLDRLAEAPLNTVVNKISDELIDEYWHKAKRVEATEMQAIDAVQLTVSESILDDLIKEALNDFMPGHLAKLEVERAKARETARQNANILAAKKEGQKRRMLAKQAKSEKEQARKRKEEQEDAKRKAATRAAARLAEIAQNAHLASKSEQPTEHSTREQHKPDAPPRSGGPKAVPPTAQELASERQIQHNAKLTQQREAEQQKAEKQFHMAIAFVDQALLMTQTQQRTVTLIPVKQPLTLKTLSFTSVDGINYTLSKAEFAMPEAKRTLNGYKGAASKFTNQLDILVKVRLHEAWAPEAHDAVMHFQEQKRLEFNNAMLRLLQNDGIPEDLSSGSVNDYCACFISPAAPLPKPTREDFEKQFDFLINEEITEQTSDEELTQKVEMLVGFYQSIYMSGNIVTLRTICQLFDAYMSPQGGLLEKAAAAAELEQLVPSLEEQKTWSRPMILIMQRKANHFIRTVSEREGRIVKTHFNWIDDGIYASANEIDRINADLQKKLETEELPKVEREGWELLHPAAKRGILDGKSKNQIEADVLRATQQEDRERQRRADEAAGFLAAQALEAQINGAAYVQHNAEALMNRVLQAVQFGADYDQLMALTPDQRDQTLRNQYGI